METKEIFGIKCWLCENTFQNVIFPFSIGHFTCKQCSDSHRGENGLLYFSKNELKKIYPDSENVSGI